MGQKSIGLLMMEALADIKRCGSRNISAPGIFSRGVWIAAGYKRFGSKEGRVIQDPIRIPLKVQIMITIAI